MNDNNHWLVIRYKINQLKRLEHNLKNQKLNFYSPKITKKSYKTKALKEIILFPGYGFIKNGIAFIHSIKYTKGILDVLKFGNNYAFISNDKINELADAEKLSKELYGKVIPLAPPTNSHLSNIILSIIIRAIDDIMNDGPLTRRVIKPTKKPKIPAPIPESNIK